MIIEIGYSSTDVDPKHEGYYSSIKDAKKALDEIAKITNAFIVRPLTESDKTQVETLDEESNDYVSQWLEDNEDYAWGAFLGETLIGYCTTGYADDCCDAIANHPAHTDDSILLSDVFILPEYRHNGYAIQMITDALEFRHKSDNNPHEAVFLTVLCDNLKTLYNRLGFSSIDENGNMVQIPNPTK